MTDTEARQITQFLEDPFRGTANGAATLRLADAVRALLAERDALKAKAQPVRKLREYKGVTYQDGAFYVNLVDSYLSASEIIYKRSISLGLTDADHAAIYALKDDPFEPVETVEDVLHSYWLAVVDNTGVPASEFATRLRAAVAAEGVGDE